MMFLKDGSRLDATNPRSLLKKGAGSELTADHATEKPPRRGACTLFQQARKGTVGLRWASFTGILAMVAGAAMSSMAGATETAERCGPAYIHAEPTTGKLLVLCEKNDTIARIDPVSGMIEAYAETGEAPFALSPHPDGERLYITCRRGQEVLELDTRSLQTLRRFPLIGDPTGVAVSGDGRWLYVAVHSLDQIAVFDVETGSEARRLIAGNGPEMVRLSKLDGRIYVTNLLPNPLRLDDTPFNEITVIEGATSKVIDRTLLKNANVGRWIDFTSDGALAIAAISRTKNQIPMVQVARGWVVTNGFVVISTDGELPPMQLLVDLPNQSFSDPYGLVITPDDRKFYLTCAGMDTVVAVDIAKVQEVMIEARAGKIPRPSDHLGLSRKYVTARIKVGANPGALALNDDGRELYVGNRLDDTVSVIDTASDRVVRTLIIGDPAPADILLQGERLFHSAARTFQGQFSCGSCHPDTGFDGLQYDLEPDGIGEDVLDNRNMRDVVGTGPFKWNGKNPDITTQCGTRTAKWIMRTGWLTSTQVVALATYIRSIKPVVNPYRAEDGTLTPTQRRGKELFERTVDNKGKPIPQQQQCHFCHPGPKFLDGRRADVGTRGPNDNVTLFDSAHLINIFESNPYLHDGRAATLEEIWTKYNPEDKHGLSSDWTKRQLNELVEYLKSL
ncbi:MAG: hypothetical protein ACYTFA_15850 [Planctomycetota bacterium]|jgi:YVTN family beta-propeller protein